MFLADSPTGKLITNQSSWLPCSLPGGGGDRVNWVLTWGKYGVGPGSGQKGGLGGHLVLLYAGLTPSILLLSWASQKQQGLVFFYVVVPNLLQLCNVVVQ